MLNVQPKPTTPSIETRYLPIEDYGMIGDLTTVALVGKNGSIDWCCLPDVDSPSIFGALLDTSRGGTFRLAPVDQENLSTKQIYVPETNILITRFLTHDGVGEITDFMPIKAPGTPRYDGVGICLPEAHLLVHVKEQEERDESDRCVSCSPGGETH